ncbi:hypothetical protein E2320_019117 [Naja naja]|nr:hypothetical protein E2320_019117 [Naja naja]
MATTPSFPSFQPTSETWDSYINCFDCFLDAANLPEISSHRKKAYFLSFCRAAVFDTATTLLAPQMVKSVTWDDLQEILGNHFAPKPSQIAQRHALHRWNQAEGETTSMHIAALRRAAFHCSFRDLDDMLLDQLVCGVRNLHLQRHLQAKANLMLKMAVEEAQAAELSTLSAAEVQRNPASKDNTAVHYDNVFPEVLNEEGDVNHLRQPRPPQKKI